MRSNILVWRTKVLAWRTQVLVSGFARAIVFFGSVDEQIGLADTSFGVVYTWDCWLTRAIERFGLADARIGLVFT